MVKVRKLEWYAQRFKNKQLDPYEFEEMVCALLIRLGWKDIQLSEKTGDRGVDITGIERDQRTYVQVKHHNQSISREVVQKLHSVMDMDKVKRGYIVCSSTFSKPAREWAAECPLNILLVDRDLFENTCSMVMESNIIGFAKKTPKLNFKWILDYPQYYINKYLFSHPRNIENVDPSSIRLYFHLETEIHFKFSLDAKYFNSSLTHMIGEDTEKNKKATYDGKDLFLSDSSYDYGQIDLSELISELNRYNIPYSSPDLSIAAEINERVLSKKIQQYYRRKIVYEGITAQEHATEVSPLLDDITIHGFEVVIIPFIDYSFSSKDKMISISSASFGPWRRFSYLCNTCFRVYGGKAHFCIGCGKVLCNDCRSILKRHLIFKKTLCSTCFETTQPAPYDEVLNKSLLDKVKSEYKRRKDLSYPTYIEDRYMR